MSGILYRTILEGETGTEVTVPRTDLPEHEADQRPIILQKERERFRRNLSLSFYLFLSGINESGRSSSPTVHPY